VQSLEENGKGREHPSPKGIDILSCSTRQGSKGAENLPEKRRGSKESVRTNRTENSRERDATLLAHPLEGRVLFFLGTKVATRKVRPEAPKTNFFTYTSKKAKGRSRVKEQGPSKAGLGRRGRKGHRRRLK